MIALPTEAFAKTSKRNLITQINAKDKSITVNGKLYVMRYDVRITYKGKKAKFAALKKGMRVSLSARIRSFKRKGKNSKNQQNIYEARLVSAHDFTPPKKKK